MKILYIADIHGAIDSVQKAKKFIESNNIDLVIILGDLPGYGVFRNRELSIKEAKSILDSFQNLKILAIPGNCDPPEILDLFNELEINLHERYRDINGVRIIGFGGSNITPFNTSFEMTEEEIYTRLKKLMDLVNPVNRNEIILALHCPPKDTNCDKVASGEHVGSISIRRIIEEFQPSLVLSSHIHEAGGSLDKVGQTKVVNIGMLSHGNIGIIEIDDGIKINLMKIKNPMNLKK